MWTSRAAVLRRTGGPLVIETLAIGPLAAGDVLVRVRAASLCHTDLEAIEGALVVPLPAVLGHEAAGEVAAVGADVTGLGIGDRVVLSWNPHCGRCFYCERAQPILCRTFGPPMATPGDDCETNLGTCELCFIHASTEEIAACEMAVPHELEAELLAGLPSNGDTVVAFALLR